MNNFSLKPNMMRNSYIRVLHASPNAPPVDIYANGVMIAKNLAYRQLTDYLSVPPGTYNIEVYPTGQKINPVIDTDFNIPCNSAYTVAAIGYLDDISLMPIREVYMPQINRDKSYVRFIHLSPNAPAVDVTLPDGTMLFENVSYKEHTKYLEVDPGNYKIQVKPAGSDQPVLTIPNATINPGMIYSVYAVGLVGEDPPLEALLYTDSVY